MAVFLVHGDRNRCGIDVGLDGGFKNLRFSDGLGTDPTKG